MQDLRALTAEWIAAAQAKGIGYRVWRWEEYVDHMPYIIWHFRLLAPGEVQPDEPGVIIVP